MQTGLGKTVHLITPSTNNIDRSALKLRTPTTGQTVYFGVSTIRIIIPALCQNTPTLDYHTAMLVMTICASAHLMSYTQKAHVPIGHQIVRQRIVHDLYVPLPVLRVKCRYDRCCDHDSYL